MPPSIYDREETEADPVHWFEPPPMEPLADLHALPALTQPESADWHWAEQTLSRQLAAAVDAIARLDVRLLSQPRERR